MNQDDYKKIISIAIDREVEAYTFYRTISEKTKDKNLKSIFNELAEDEESHKSILERFLAEEPKNLYFSEQKPGSITACEFCHSRNPDYLHFPESKDHKVLDKLATPPLSADLSPVEGIIIAAKKELEAMQFYTQMANACTDPAQKAVFLDLVRMERKHKSKLEDLYVDMQFPDIWA